MKKLRKLEEYYEEKIKVRSFDTDFQTKLKMTAIFDYFQEVTAKHCIDTPLGRDHMLESNIFWALARIKIEIENIPKINEEVVFKTWSQSHDKVFAIRGYEIKKDGVRASIASSDWIVMDIITRRPHKIKKLEEVGIDLSSYKLEKMDKLGKINIVGTEIVKYEKKVSYQDIDMYGHVNNVKYVEWALSTYGTEDFEQMEIKSMQVNFVAEAKSGERIVIKRYADGDTHYIEGYNVTTDNKTFQAEFIWRKSV